MRTQTFSVKNTVHIIITFALMFGFGFLPQFSLLTESGMKIIGILLGAIYGISFCGPAWPSLLAMGALVILQVAPSSSVLSTGLGSDSVVFMIFCFIFVAVLEQNKITEFMASWLMTKKIVKGKPWLYSYFLIIGTMFTGAFGSSFPAMIVFWSILISTCKKYNIKPYSKYPTLMFMGICIGGLASSSTWLFRGNPLFVNATLKNISQGALEFNFGIYAFFSFLLWMIVIAMYIMACKYFFKVDISSMVDIDDSAIDKKYLTLNKKQKVAMAYITIFLATYVIIGFVPTGSAAGIYLAQFGVTIPTVIILALMSITKVDGEPILDVNQAGRAGVVWDTVILTGALLSLSTIMMTTDTGITNTILALLNPVFAGKGMVFMCVTIVVISVILTNFMANTTVALMFCPVIYTFSVQMGFNPMPMMAMMLVSVHIAYITPAASPFSSLLFGFTSSWVNAKDIYKYGVITCVVMLIVFLAVGIPLSNILM